MPAPKPNADADRAQVLVHRQRREADVDPVQVGDEIAEDQERHQP